MAMAKKNSGRERPVLGIFLQDVAVYFGHRFAHNQTTSAAHTKITTT
jgi:hypothetical protein